MKLNLGCGNKVMKGYINIDSVKSDVVDKVMDLNKLPYPFKTNSIDEVYMRNILEHLDDPIQVIHEVKRILKASGKLVIIVPHFSCAGCFIPEHKTFWRAGYFRNFLINNKRNSLDNYPLFREMDLKIVFYKGILFWNYLVEFIVNLSKTNQMLYEFNCAFIFPAREVKVEFSPNKRINDYAKREIMTQQLRG